MSEANKRRNMLWLVRFTRYCLLVFLFVLAFGRDTSFCMAQAHNANDAPSIAAPLDVPSNLVSLSLTGHFSYLKDPDHHFSIEDVAFGEPSNRFIPIKKNLAMRFTPDAIWLKLSFRRGEAWPRNAFLNLLPVYLQDVRIFVPKVSNPARADDFEMTQRGSGYPDAFPSRVQVSHVVPLSFPADSALVTVYIRAVTHGTMGLRGWLASESGIMDLVQTRLVSAVGLVTLSLGSALLSLIYWIYSRRLYFLHMSFMFLADSLYVCTTSGIVLFGALGFSGAFNRLIISESLLLLIVANILFVRENLRRPYRGRFLGWFINGSMWFCGLAIVGDLFGIYRLFVVPLLLVILCLLAVFVVSGILFGQARKKPGASAAFLAGLIKFASAGFSIAWSLGGAETNGFFEYSYWIAVAFFTPLMAFSIMQKARSVDRMRQETTSLRIARRAERAARDLVKIRTSELEAAKEMAELALVAEQEGQAEQLRFIDVVRHQYQTPLSVIRTSLASLRHALPEMNDANRQRMHRIDSAVSDLVQLLDSSLQKSRMRGTELLPDAQPVALEAFLEKILKYNETLHAGRKFVLELDGSISHWKARMDSSMVGMALQNLIDNSVKFSPADTIVKLSCRMEDRMLIISVEDDSFGIPPEELGLVGKRFFRATNAGGVAGTGLGLHIVKSVALAHNGDFKIENKSTGGVVASISLRLTNQVQ